MIDWTVERVAALPTDRVKILRENAVRNGKSDVVALCDAELERRKPARKRSPPAHTQARDDQIVTGFHFVCPGEKGVTRTENGTAWTGTWVVDKTHAKHGSKIGAYVALHASKSEPSYLQGIIKDWRISKREREYAEGRPVRIEAGIDFLLQLTSESYEWKGDGAGEKGYVWSDPK